MNKHMHFLLYLHIEMAEVVGNFYTVNDMTADELETQGALPSAVKELM